MTDTDQAEDDGDVTSKFEGILESYRKAGDPKLRARYVRLPLVWIDEAFRVLPTRLHRVAIAVGHLSAYLIDEESKGRRDRPFQIAASELALFGTDERQVKDGLRLLAAAGLVELTPVVGKPSIVRILVGDEDIRALAERWHERTRAKARERALKGLGFTPKGNRIDGIETWHLRRRGLNVRILPDDSRVRVLIDGADRALVKASFKGRNRRFEAPPRGTAIGKAERCTAIVYSSARFRATFIKNVRTLVARLSGAAP